MPANNCQLSVGDESSAVSRVDSSSLASWTLSLPSVSPIPVAITLVKPRPKDSVNEVRFTSDTPTASANTNSRRRRRPKNWSPRAWYTVGVSGGGVLSPHKPRCEFLCECPPSLAAVLTLLLLLHQLQVDAYFMQQSHNYWMHDFRGSQCSLSGPSLASLFVYSREGSIQAAYSSPDGCRTMLRMLLHLG